MRAAVCTASPETRRSPAKAPATTSPVSSPMRSRGGKSVSSALSDRATSRRASAARIALAASSPWAVG
jgi:hypothetical protein